MTYKIEKLTDREHILRRPSMYIGSISNEEIEDFTKGEFLEIKTSTLPPGLVKIINEVIDNSIDAILKTGKGNTVSVDIQDSKIVVEDNSAGFPLKGNSNEEPVVLALGNARAGSNFNDDDNIGQMGTNGVGAFATNCFSKSFKATSITDGTRVQAIWENNANLKDVKVDQVKKNSGTKIEFEPDLERFKLTTITDDVKDAINTRLHCLAYTYPKINFKFNNNKIKAPKQLTDWFDLKDDPFVSYKSGDYEVFVVARSTTTPNFSFVNGLNIRDGGSHLDIIMNDIAKAFNNVRGVNASKADIVNTLQLIFVGTKFKNLRFNSQTKEKITNSAAEVREYLGDLEPLVNKIAKSKQIKDFIKATSQARELRSNKAKLNSVKRTKIKSDKFLDSQGDREILMIVEGDSAMGGLVPALGRKGIAYYALKGKPLNAYKATAQKVAVNKELSELLAIIHQSNFKKIAVASDQDLDGMHIRGLLLGFVDKFLPEHKDRVYFLQTPVKGIFKNDKIVRWTYDINETLTPKSGEMSIYFKGLGTLEANEMNTIVATDGFDKILQQVDFSNIETSLESWLGDDSDKRKELILKNNFSNANIWFWIANTL